MEPEVARPDGAPPNLYSSGTPTSPPSEPSSDHGATRLTGWLARGRDRLTSLLRYGAGPYKLLQGLSRVRDKRRRPRIPTEDVLRSLLFAATLRIPSLNALEASLKTPGFQRLLGRSAVEGTKAFSAETASRVLDGANLDTVRGLLLELIEQAERKKLFREGEPGCLRVVAFDGWEQYKSFHRHCDDCLTREVSVGDNKKRTQPVGDTKKRIQYYHRWVVALLVGEKVDVGKRSANPIWRPRRGCATIAMGGAPWRSVLGPRRRPAAASAGRRSSLISTEVAYPWRATAASTGCRLGV